MLRDLPKRLALGGFAIVWYMDSAMVWPCFCYVLLIHLGVLLARNITDEVVDRDSTQAVRNWLTSALAVALPMAFEISMAAISAKHASVASDHRKKSRD